MKTVLLLLCLVCACLACVPAFAAEQNAAPPGGYPAADYPGTGRPAAYYPAAAAPRAVPSILPRETWPRETREEAGLPCGQTFLFKPAAQEAEEKRQPPGGPEPGDGLWTRFAKRVGQAWRSSDYDLYIPAYTWHNRLLYDDSKAKKYNEHPWGGGLGKSFTDEDGDWHALYAMGFSDSNYHFQPIAGYGFIKNWRPGQSRDFAVGVGFTASVTAREEYNYIPLPLPLPLISVEYKNLSVQAAYIPGGYNDGNVLFSWIRLHFD